MPGLPSHTTNNVQPSTKLDSVGQDDEFYSAVENWFKENYPGDELK